MSYFDENYKSLTGKSRLGGVVSGFINNVDLSFHKNFASSSHARLRTGLVVLTLAGIITYMSKKDTIDDKLDSLKSDYVELREVKKLERIEREVSNRIADYQKELNNLDGDYLTLQAIKDSLLSESKKSSDSLLYLNEQIDNSKSILDSIENVISGYNFKSSNSNGSNRYSYTTTSRRGFLGLFKRKKTVYHNNYGDSYFDSDVWVPIPQGSSLSEIAKKYHGDPKLFSELARINNIENPNVVIHGMPIKLIDDSILSYSGTFKGELPEFKPVLINESLDKFISRTGILAPKQEVLDYNVDNGNIISGDGVLVRNTGVVYLKKEWFD